MAPAQPAGMGNQAIGRVLGSSPGGGADFIVLFFCWSLRLVVARCKLTGSTPGKAHGLEKAGREGGLVRTIKSSSLLCACGGMVNAIWLQTERYNGGKCSRPLGYVHHREFCRFESGHARSIFIQKFGALGQWWHDVN